MNKREVIAIISISILLLLLVIISFGSDKVLFGPGGIELSFISPTPTDGFIQEENYITIASSSSSPIGTGEHSTFLDFDNSLYAWYRFDNDGDFIDHSFWNHDGINTGTSYT